MTTRDSDTEPLIAALRGDLPTADDDARMRARLAAAGVCIGTSAVGLSALSASSAHAAVGSGVTGAAAANGVAMNGVAMNGVAMNGVAMNGVAMNGVAMNGVAAVGAVKTGGVLTTLVTALPTGTFGVKALVVVGALATGVGYPLLKTNSKVTSRSGASDSQITAPTTVAERALNTARTREEQPVVVAHSNASTGANEGLEMAALNPGARVANGQAEDAAEDLGVNAPTTGNWQPHAGAAATRGLETKTNAPRGAYEPLPHKVRGHQSSEKAPEKVAESAPHSAKQGVATTQAMQSHESGLMPNTADNQDNLLAEETSLIERALRAQRAGDKSAARTLLGIHQQRFPAGRLTIERNKMLQQLDD